MTQKVKEMAPKIWDAIQKSENVLLCFHPNPDPDTIGCCMSMKKALEGLGKKATVIKGDSAVPSWVSKLPGGEGVVQKNYLEINPKDFDLFLIMDSSSPDMISKLGAVQFPDSMTTVVIDHHQSNSEFGQINLVDSSYIACCEIIYDLLKEGGVQITKEMAAFLLLGIYTDSGGFKYERTDQNTFLAASELSRRAPDFTRAIFELENNESEKSLRYLGLALNSIHTYFGGKVAVSEISNAELVKNGFSEKDTEHSEISNLIKSVVGWEVGLTFIEVEPGTVKMSFRTRDADKFDLSKIALALGGGGHKAAAGASIKKPFEEAKKLLLEKLAEVYPALGQP